MPTEQKAYTPGAERAAAELREGVLGGECIHISGWAEIISRETGDCEMLEALSNAVAWIKLLWGEGATTKDEFAKVQRFVVHSAALIAKVEGR